MSLSIHIKDTVYSFKQAKVMGILNVTSDSFFDGGSYLSVENALRRVKVMIEEGVDIIDIGGYSSRPGATDITVQEELDRVMPVLLAIKAETDLPISIDTFRAAVAEEALKAHSVIINDISAGDDDENMLPLVARYGAPFIAMHKKGSPKNMQINPQYEDVVTEVYEYFLNKMNVFKQLNIQNVILDPGFGFGKSIAHNYELLNNLKLFGNFNCPILCGLSRKSMINKVLNIKASDALNGTAFLHAFCLQAGASILRVHDVKEAVQQIKLWNAILQNP